MGKLILMIIFLLTHSQIIAGGVVNFISLNNPFQPSRGRVETDSVDRRFFVHKIKVDFNNLSKTDSNLYETYKLQIYCRGVAKIEVMFDTLTLDTNDILIANGIKSNKSDFYSFRENTTNCLNFSSNFHSDSIFLILYKQKKSKTKVVISNILVSKFLTYSGCGSSNEAIFPCFKDANCPSGNNYQDIKRSAVHIRFVKPVGGDYTCGEVGSGTIINNLNRDYKPYVYTATHIYSNIDLYKTNAQYFRYYFNYEASSLRCNYTGEDDIVLDDFLDSRENYLLGANLVAYHNDNIIVELNEKPKLSWKVFYAGFSKNTALGSFVNFSHPLGSRKKIAFGTFSDTKGDGLFESKFQDPPGRIVLDPVGILHEGSSGSGFFDIITKRLMSNLRSWDESYSETACNGYKSYNLNSLKEFWNNAINDVGQSISLSSVLTNGNQLLSFMDGEDYCPDNNVLLSNSNFASVLTGTNNNAKTYTINDFSFANGNFLLDMQAVEQIRITSTNNKTSRLKPLAGKVRLSVHPCTRGNPSSGRMESSESTNSNYRFFANLYPNPSDGNVTLSFSEIGSYSIVIFNIHGQRVYEASIGSTNQFNLQSELLESGLYFVQVSNGTDVESRKLIMQ